MDDIQARSGSVKAPSKADQIRALNDGRRSTTEIAALVGCLPSYVRVVARQRGTGSYFQSTADRNYQAKPEVKAKRSARKRARHAVDPDFRAALKRADARWMANGGRDWRNEYKRSWRARRKAEAAT